MDKYLILGLVLGAVAAASCSSLPTMPWDDEDVSIMCLISTDYYNKVSAESALYRLQGNGTEYRTNETSSYRQLHFTIKETTCQKPEDEVTEDCAFLEDGLVKSCLASIMVEDDRDVVVVTCDEATLQRSRVRRSRGGGRRNEGRNGGNNGSSNRGNKGGRNGGRNRGKTGSGSSIAGGGSRGNSRYA